MSLLQIVWKSLRQHAFSTGVTAFSIALAGALLLSVWILQDQTRRTFTGMDAGFDAVLGARGSKLQLVMNSIFHLEESSGNLRLEDFTEIQKNPHVELAVPLALGDNVKGHRVVGTSLELFTRSEYRPGLQHVVEAGGRFFDPNNREAVLGSFAAHKLGLKPGDSIHPSHGLNYAEGHEHEDEYVVVGILKPSNTPADRVVWIPLEGLQLMTGHSEKAAEELSAVLVKLKAGNATAGFLLDQKYNKEGTRLTWAWPIGRIMAQLFDKIGWFDRILELIAGLVAVVAVASVTASTYNSMNERRREIAILRALGARRFTIFSAVVMEATVIATVGMVVGIVFSAGIFAVVGGILRTQVGVILEGWAGHSVLWWGPLVMVSLAALAGTIPAWKACRVDVAQNLSPTS
ncbi:MAG: ABC transporter permease [Verrucomicrobia bacterium]|nr:ABC transporter permease [Verrucomicrobiota bacterium]